MTPPVILFVIFTAVASILLALALTALAAEGLDSIGKGK